MQLISVQCATDCAAPCPAESDIMHAAQMRPWSRPVKPWTRRSAALTAAPFRLRRKMPPTAMERSEEHTSELQSLMRTSYAVFCLKKKTHYKRNKHYTKLTKENDK